MMERTWTAGVSPANAGAGRRGRRRSILALVAAGALLTACETDQIGERGPAPPLPTSGPIIYSCADGTQLSVTFENNQAQVAVIGGVSVVLPNIGTADAPHYSNGRYGIVGRGAQTNWEVGRRAPTSCRGG